MCTFSSLHLVFVFVFEFVFVFVFSLSPQLTLHELEEKRVRHHLFTLTSLTDSHHCTAAQSTHTSIKGQNDHELERSNFTVLVIFDNYAIIHHGLEKAVVLTYGAIVGFQFCWSTLGVDN